MEDKPFELCLDEANCVFEWSELDGKTLKMKSSPDGKVVFGIDVENEKIYVLRLEVEPEREVRNEE